MKRTGSGSRTFALSVLLHTALLVALTNVLGVAGTGPERDPAVFCGSVEEFRVLRETPPAPDPILPTEACIPAPATFREPDEIPMDDPFPDEVVPVVARTIEVPVARFVLARPRAAEPPVQVNSITAAAALDLVGMSFTRYGGHANDTVNADCYFVGVVIRRP